MSNLVSRVLVVLVGLPLVLGLVWLGGWWLCVLAGAVGLLALHEFYAMTRALRPIVLAGYLGLVLTLVAAQAGGFVWVAGSIFATVALAFLLKGVADTRQSATVAVGGTLTYTITVTNGASPGGGATEVAIHDHLPSSLVLQNAIWQGSPPLGSTCTISGNTFDCTYGDVLPKSTSASVLVTAKVLASASSPSASRLELGSSSTTSRGRPNSARASAMRWRCPAESRAPPSPP